MMDKIFEMLGVEKLDESKQNKLKEALQSIIDVKASEMSESKVEELLKEKKEELVEKYETKFETYKEEITEKFSNFVDSILEKEMVIPENIIRYAHLGELYDDLIEQFKVRLAIDEDLIDKETKNLLKEAKEEIEDLRNNLDESKGKLLDYEKDSAEMAAHIYLREKCDGLTEIQKKHVMNILGDELIKENIDNRFDYLVESLNINLNEGDDKDDDDDGDDDDKKDDNVTEMECPKCGNIESVKEGDDPKCSECGATLKEKKEDKDKDKKDEDDKDDKDEKDVKESIVNQSKHLWMNVLKSNKI
jgi:hypothetical protein